MFQNCYVVDLYILGDATTADMLLDFDYFSDIIQIFYEKNLYRMFSLLTYTSNAL